MTDVGILLALSAGVLSFLSPCVLPLVPSYLAFVTGMSLEDLEEGVERGRVFRTALLFTLGFSFIFIVVLGGAASFLGQFLKSYEMWIARIGGVAIIILGLHLAGVFRITPLLREKRIHLSGTPAGALGAIGVGMAFGAGWTACIGPVLGAILTYAMVQETFWSGIGLVSVYSAGLALPFLASALALDRFLVAFRKIRRFLGVIQVASGVLLILIGLLLVTGAFTVLTTWLLPLTPDFLMERI